MIMNINYSEITKIDLTYLTTTIMQKGNEKYCLLKLTVHLPRNVKTKGMSMLNASAHVPWDLLEPLVIPSSRTLVSNVCQLCFP